MTAQLRYALGAAGQLIDIASLSPETRHAFGPYQCPGCDREIIPALGAKMAHHFRHKIEVICNPETYLHRTAKQAFFETFTEAVRTGRPYPVSRSRDQVCRHLEAQFGITCQLKPVIETFDLTRWVRKASLEKQAGRFIADVLLESDDGSVQLLIELAVTHLCEPEKISSGLRIIEIPITSEEDIARLRSGLALDGEQARSYNLAKRPPLESPTCPGCDKEINVFAIYRSGKSLLVNFKPEKVAAALKDPVFIRAKRTTVSLADKRKRPIEVISRHVAEAYFNGIRVRSCTLCMLGAINPDTGQWSRPMRCFERQADVGHNEAATCKTFIPFPSWEAQDREREMQDRVGKAGTGHTSIALSRGPR